MKFIKKFESSRNSIDLISDILVDEELDFEIDWFTKEYSGIFIKINILKNSPHPFLYLFYSKSRYSISHLPFSHKKKIIDEISINNSILSRIEKLANYKLYNFFLSVDGKDLCLELVSSR